MAKIMECDSKLAYELFGLIVHDNQKQKIAQFREAITEEVLNYAAENACLACASKTTGKVCHYAIQSTCAIRVAILAGFRELVFKAEYSDSPVKNPCAAEIVVREETNGRD